MSVKIILKVEKGRLYPLSRKYTFGKTAEVKLTPPPPPSFFGLKVLFYVSGNVVIAIHIQPF